MLIDAKYLSKYIYVKMLSDRDKLRIATIVDCEGYVDVYKFVNRGHAYSRPVIIVVNADRSYLENYLLKPLGFGKIFKTTSIKKQLWKFQVTYRKALLLSKLIIEESILKKDKHLEIIDHYKTKDRKRNH